MIYAMPQLKKKSRYMTYGVIKYVLEHYGHDIRDEITDNIDAVLYSLADVMDMRGLRRLRESTSLPIIVGGHYAFFFWSAIIYSDIVWVGEIFDFAKLESLPDIANSVHSYIPGREWESIIPSTHIDWSLVPIVQQHNNSAYYWGGVGCKNKCKFCATSWMHQHNENTLGNIRSAREICKRHSVYLMVVSNEYVVDIGSQTRDMLAVDYLNTPVRGGWVRMGIEFAGETTRAWMGKPISNDELYAVFQKSKVENVALRLFHISGYESIDDWHAYFGRVARMLSVVQNTRLIHFNFTNLQYQNYTPLYRNRWSINPEYYISARETKAWYDKLRQNTSHILVGKPSLFQHVAYRMGIELSTELEQIEYWFSLYTKRNKYSANDMYKSLITTGVFNTPYVRTSRDGHLRVDVTGGEPELLDSVV